jgi:hypothetical protein
VGQIGHSPVEVEVVEVEVVDVVDVVSSLAT